MTNNPQIRVLESLEEAKNYRNWLIALGAHRYEGRVFELGSGLGSYARRIIEDDKENLITSFHLTEIDDETLDMLKETFEFCAKVQIHDLKNGIPDNISAESFVSWNVLEHIEDDVEALEIANKVCISGSPVFVLVPAMQFAYSKFDLELNHFRRYSKMELTEKAHKAGLRDVQVFYVNSFGIVGWLILIKWLNFRPRNGALLRVFDQFVFPLQILFERYFTLPFGQSLVLRARTK
jgi:hypothetical protein